MGRQDVPLVIESFLIDLDRAITRTEAQRAYRERGGVRVRILTVAVSGKVSKKQ
jgi:hypothetical protein